jgi:hypothetical protein
MNNTFTFVTDSCRFFKNHLTALAILIIPILIPVSIFFALANYYFQDIKYIRYLATIPYALTFPLFQSVLILYISSALSGAALHKGQYYGLALRLWVPLAGLYIMTTIALITGFALLVIPALIVMVRTSFSEFYCILYNKSPIEALKLSWHATREYQWVIFAGLAIIWLITNIPLYIVKQFISSMELWNPVSTSLYQLAQSFLALLLTIFYFRIFTLLPEKISSEIHN